MKKLVILAGISLAGASGASFAQFDPPSDTGSSGLDALFATLGDTGNALAGGIDQGGTVLQTFVEAQEGIFSNTAGRLGELEPDEGDGEGPGENGLTVGLRRGGEAVGTGLQDQGDGDGGIKAGGAALADAIRDGSSAAQQGLLEGSEALFGANSDPEEPTGLSGGIQALQAGFDGDPEEAAGIGANSLQSSFGQGETALMNGAGNAVTALEAGGMETAGIIMRGASDGQIVIDEAIDAGTGGDEGEGEPNPLLVAAQIMIDASSDTGGNVANNLAGAGGDNAGQTADDATSAIAEGAAATAAGFADDIARGGPDDGNGGGGGEPGPGGLPVGPGDLEGLIGEGG